MADPSGSSGLPALPLEKWNATRDTLHLWMQIVGKVRLALHPKLNHWWHVPFYVTPRGLSTQPIPLATGRLEIEFDFLNHELAMDAGAMGTRRFALRDGLSVAAFHKHFFENMAKLGLRHVPFLNKPYDVPAVSTTPFDQDTEHAKYDPHQARRYHEAIMAADGIFQEFRGRFLGKSSPVHCFWHSMDLAVTRFSGRPAPEKPGANQVQKEAYSHEVISCGWWPGDKQVRGPAFYGYAAPAPQGLYEQPLAPSSARWWPENGYAILMHDDARAEPDPRRAVLDFLESVYQASARLADWDLEGFRLENFV